MGSESPQYKTQLSHPFSISSPLPSPTIISITLSLHTPPFLNFYCTFIHGDPIAAVKTHKPTNINIFVEMDIDRPHFRTTSTGSSTAAAATTSELFICFTSRLSSSSSMKLSKSILSPGRPARDGGPTTLSSSLSRRLRTNGSLKGGQASPFFTTSGKKRGCAFENPEPSSPKVTCIGQVRVKTKKKVKQTRSLSKRRTGAGTGAGGEVSFSKIEQSSGDGDDKASNQQQQQRYSNASAHYPAQECLPHRNQRWVHLPISICEALRTFGAEFSCLFPCKSSCFSTAEREKIEKQNGGENGCGAVFRWLVAVNDGEEGKRREIELVVGGGDEEEEEEFEEEEKRVSMRRHVFEDIEVKDDRIELKGQSLEREDEAAGRVSICIPPKNALLLMRCRSDPIKMAALANNQNQHTPIQQQLLEVEEEEEEEIVVDGGEPCVVSKDESLDPEIAVSSVETTNEVENKLEMEGDGEDELEMNSEEMVQEKTEMLALEIQEEEKEEEEEVEEENVEEEEEVEELEVESNMSSFEDLLEQENAEEFEEEQVEQDTPLCHLSPSDEEDLQSNESPPILLQESAAAVEKIAQESTISSEESVSLNDEQLNQEAAAPPASTAAEEEEKEKQLLLEEEEEEEEEVATMAEPEELVASKTAVEEKKEKEGPLLPECLLLMMCEPKLSMEVSKETWVCSTDFMRWLPERPRKAVARAAKPGDRDPWKRRLSIDSKPKPATEKNHELQQPPRSSCSLPVATAAAASMATMLEQKLVNAVGYEPFVLTRCKSEPMKTAAAKLMPESCFWKNAVRKLEPHRCAATGVGAAGVGF